MSIVRDSWKTCACDFVLEMLASVTHLNFVGEILDQIKSRVSSLLVFAM